MKVTGFFFAVKPEIVRAGLAKIATTKVNRTHIWDAEIIGEPVTEKFWYKDDSSATLEDTEKLTIENEDYNTRIVIKKAQRKVRFGGVQYADIQVTVTVGYRTLPHPRRE